MAPTPLARARAAPTLKPRDARTPAGNARGVGQVVAARPTHPALSARVMAAEVSSAARTSDRRHSPPLLSATHPRHGQGWGAPTNLPSSNGRSPRMSREIHLELPAAARRLAGTDWRQRHTVILEGLWNGYNNADEFDPNTVACMLGLAEEIRLSIAAGLLDRRPQSGANIETWGDRIRAEAVKAEAAKKGGPRLLAHGDRATCSWEDNAGSCGAPIVYLAGSDEWIHDGIVDTDHRAAYRG